MGADGVLPAQVVAGGSAPGNRGEAARAAVPALA